MTDALVRADIETYLRDERAMVDTALARVAPRLLDRLPARVRGPVRYALDGSGKRLRPILCVATYRAVARAAAPEAVYAAACAIELIHTYSLVHDDLPSMDDDDLRRGRPTAHRVWSVAEASVAGAIMIPLAASLLAGAGQALGLPHAERIALLADLARAAGAQGMVGGQVMDLDAEGRDVDLDELEMIHRRKTGALFGASLRTGGRLAGAGAGVLDALGACGAALGLAFQITDDILDETGDAAVLGKSAQRDRAQRKATFAARLGVPAAREQAARAADEAVAILRAAGVEDATLESLARHAIERDR